MPRVVMTTAFDEIVQSLFGELVDAEAIAKMSPDPSSVHAPGHLKAVRVRRRVAKRSPQDQEKLERNVARVSNAVGLAAGAAGTYSAARNYGEVKRGGKGGALTQAMTRRLSLNSKQAARLGVIGAGSALGLQTANVAGDVITARVLGRDAKVTKGVKFTDLKQGRLLSVRRTVGGQAIPGAKTPRTGGMGGMGLGRPDGKIVTKRHPFDDRLARASASGQQFAGAPGAAAQRGLPGSSPAAPAPSLRSATGGPSVVGNPSPGAGAGTSQQAWQRTGQYAGTPPRSGPGFPGAQHPPSGATIPGQTVGASRTRLTWGSRLNRVKSRLGQGVKTANRKISIAQMNASNAIGSAGIRAQAGARNFGASVGAGARQAGQGAQAGLNAVRTKAGPAMQRAGNGLRGLRRTKPAGPAPFVPKQFPKGTGGGGVKAGLIGAGAMGLYMTGRRHGENSAYAKRDTAVDVDIAGTFSKFDNDKQRAYGWASVVTMNGEPVVDRQGDYIGLEDIEEAAYTYVRKSRVAGDMHRRTTGPDGSDSPHKAGELIESVVFTPDKCHAMGLPASFAGKWWMGVQVEDPEVWQEVKKGRRTGFSIHGKGLRKDTTLDEIRSGR